VVDGKQKHEMHVESKNQYRKYGSNYTTIDHGSPDQQFISAAYMKCGASGQGRERPLYAIGRFVYELDKGDFSERTGIGLT